MPDVFSPGESSDRSAQEWLNGDLHVLRKLSKNYFEVTDISWPQDASTVFDAAAKSYRTGYTNLTSHETVAQKLLRAEMGWLSRAHDTATAKQIGGVGDDAAEEAGRSVVDIALTCLSARAKQQSFNKCMKEAVLSDKQTRPAVRILRILIATQRTRADQN